jgi:hypothetical protein
MDSTETSRYVRKVPIGDIVQSYSMTLVGAGKQRLWHDLAQRLRVRWIAHQLKLGQPLHRQVRK